jgi:ABC-type lipoprotein release transport system permease subunit
VTVNIYLKMAWRNVWRNKRRTLILISAISVGLAGLMVSLGLTRGWTKSSIDKSLNSYVTHIQIHSAGFEENPLIEKNFVLTPKIKSTLDSNTEIANYGARIRAIGLVANAKYSGGAKLIGVDPDAEARMTRIDDSIVEGEYLSADNARGIVIGRDLAEKMKTKVGKKVVLTAGDVNGEGAYAAFRIVGIYANEDLNFESLYVFVNLSAAQQMLSLGDSISEIGIMLIPLGDSEQVAEALTTTIGDEGMEILPWPKLLPLMVMMEMMVNEMVGMYYIIIFIAMAFGIINSFLMAVYERVKEIGVMMAIGMKPRAVVIMVLMESLMLGMVGILLGVAIGWGLNTYWSIYGLDMSWASEGGRMWNMTTRLYFVTTLEDVITAIVSASVAMVLMTLYPAIKASRFKPVEAISQY